MGKRILQYTAFSAVFTREVGDPAQKEGILQEYPTAFHMYGPSLVNVVGGAVSCTHVPGSWPPKLLSHPQLAPGGSWLAQGYLRWPDLGTASSSAAGVHPPPSLD